MTDFHAHFLPGIDDGSDSVEMSLAMLDMWREQGISRVCATPHFYAEHTTPERFLRRRDAAYSAVLEAMDPVMKYPAILLGAEVRFFDGISAAEELPRLCLEGTDLLLLEMPFTRWTERMLGEVADIRRRGIMPVAAHLERYMQFNSKKTMERFMGMDLLIQCNAEFFLAKHTSRKAMALLRDERIHFLGSDAHNLSSRAPDLGEALQRIEKKLGPAAMERLLALEERIDAGREELLL